MGRKIQYKQKKEKIVTIPTRKGGYVRDLGTATYISADRKRREFGAHLTSTVTFE